MSKNRPPVYSSYPEIDFDLLVRSITVYPNGNVLVNRRPVGGGGKRDENSKGREGRMIKEFTAKSRAKMLHVVATSEVEFESMITLTYGKEYPVNGTRAKSHLKYFLQYLRNRYKCEFFWFLEFQLRGAPHYHIMTTVKGVKPHDRRWLAETWVRIQGIEPQRYYSDRKTGAPGRLQAEVMNVHLHTKTWEDIKKRDGAIRYATKYALKPTQKMPPPQYTNIGKFWGCSHGVRKQKDVVTEIEMNGPMLRSLLEMFSHPAKEFDVIPRYLFGADWLDALGDNIKSG